MSVDKTSVLSSLLWKFMEKSSVQIVSFLVTIVLARILSPEDYGMIALVIVFVNLANVIVEGGLNTALIQKKEADQTDFSTIFYASLFLAAFLYCILYFSADVIAEFYNKKELVSVVRVIGLSLFFFAVNSVQKAFLSRRLLFRKLFYSSLGAVLLSGVVGIVMAYQGAGVWALVAQSMISQIATTLIMWYTVKWRPTWEFSSSRFSSLFSYGWKIFVSNFIINLFINIRSLLIGKVYSAGALAYFDRGKQFPSLIIENINNSIQTVIFPVLSKEQENLTIIKAMVRRSIKMSSFIIFPLVFGLATSAEPIVRTLLTDKWNGAVPFIQIFCAAYLLMPMQVANMEAIKALGFSGTTLKLETIKKVIELIILLVSVPLGVEAIAWGVVFYNAISLFINAKPNKKLLNYGFKEQITDVMPPFWMSVIMGVSILLVNSLLEDSLVTLLFDICVGFIVYIVLSVVSRNETFIYLLKILKKQK